MAGTPLFHADLPSFGLVFFVRRRIFPFARMGGKKNWGFFSPKTLAGNGLSEVVSTSLHFSEE